MHRPLPAVDHALNQLREQANAWRADQLNTRMSLDATSRQDELGELGRAFDHMSERLQGTVRLQQQLLRDMSHELRTPLSRLRVACDSEQDLAKLRERLGREIDAMQRLVEDSLQLAWLDSETTPLPQEDIQLQALWDILRENACFESGWSASRLPCLLPADSWVRGNLNALAQALENILRNAIRHSPHDGCVQLDGCREGAIGISGCRIREPGLLRMIWSASSRPLPAWTARGPAMAVSAWA